MAEVLRDWLPSVIQAVDPPVQTVVQEVQRARPAKGVDNATIGDVGLGRRRRRLWSFLLFLGVPRQQQSQKSSQTQKAFHGRSLRVRLDLRRARLFIFPQMKKPCKWNCASPAPVSESIRSFGGKKQAHGPAVRSEP